MMKKLIILLFSISLLLPATAHSQRLKMRQKAIRAFAPARVKIIQLVDPSGSKPFRVNCISSITWKGIPDSYGTVWIEVCKPDKRSCGGGFPTRNDGQYGHQFGFSEAGEKWVIKVYTQDKKYVGFSNAFFVDGMLPACD